MSFLLWCLGCNDGCAIRQGVGCNDVIANLKCHEVRIDREHTIYGDVFSWHGVKTYIPSTKGVTFFHGFGFKRYSRLIIVSNGFVHLTIHDIGYRVTVDVELTCNGHILSRHGFRHALPSSKGVTFFFGVLDRRYCRCIHDRVGVIDLTIKHVGDLIRIDGVCSHIRHVLGWYRFGNVLPTVKRISCLRRIF